MKYLMEKLLYMLSYYMIGQLHEERKLLKVVVINGLDAFMATLN